MSARDGKRTCKPGECYPNDAIILDKTTGQMMQTKTNVTRKMTGPARERLGWIAKIGRMGVWFPTISTCVVEGSGVGAIRRMD